MALPLAFVEVGCDGGETSMWKGDFSGDTESQSGFCL